MEMMGGGIIMCTDLRRRRTRRMRSLQEEGEEVVL